MTWVVVQWEAAVEIVRIGWNIAMGLLAVVAIIGAGFYLWHGNHAEWLNWSVLYLLLTSAVIRKK